MLGGGVRVRVDQRKKIKGTTTLGQRTYHSLSSIDCWIYSMHLVCEALEFSLGLIVFDTPKDMETMDAYLSIRKNADIVAIKGALNQL